MSEPGRIDVNDDDEATAASDTDPTHDELIWVGLAMDAAGGDPMQFLVSIYGDELVVP